MSADFTKAATGSSPPSRIFRGYPQRVSPQYYGVWSDGGGQPPDWPAGSGKRVFAYLRPFRALPGLLVALGKLGCPTLVYLDQLDPRLAARYETAVLRFAPRRLDLKSVGATCDLAVLYGGHGVTAAMLLAGKPILQIPFHLEQALNARAVVRLGAGLGVNPKRPEDFGPKLTALLQSSRYTEAAQRFAARHAAFDSHVGLAKAIGEIERLL